MGKPKKKKKPVKVDYEWCFCCKDSMPVCKEGHCKVCMSYIRLH